MTTPRKESPGREPLDRAVEAALFAPLGVGLYLRDVAPGLLDMFVARGRAEVDRRREQLAQRTTTARSLGQVTIAFGVPVARRRVAARAAELRARAGEWLDEAGVRVGPVRPAPAGPTRTAGTTAPVTPAAAVPTAPAAPRVAAADAAAVAALPIPGYDTLSASQVVERLSGLEPPELAAVRDYERSHRARRTILGKIEQLSA